MGFFKKGNNFFLGYQNNTKFSRQIEFAKTILLVFHYCFRTNPLWEITGSMPSSHSLAILAILDFSRHLDTCFELTAMMQTSALYNWLLPFRGLLGSFEALIESKSGLRFRKRKVHFCKNKFDRKKFQVKSRVYDVTLLYQLLF